ncbi:MAG: hypothetical protein ACT4N2_11395 [Hyphomicrobium sp.]
MIDRSTSPWTRLAAFLCFLVAGGLLVATLAGSRVKAATARDLAPPLSWSTGSFWDSPPQAS